MKGENDMSVIPNTYVKYNNYIADANGDHRKVSTWTHASTVEMPDGSTLADATFGDTKVTQTEMSQSDYETAYTHELLVANTGGTSVNPDATTRTETSKKSQYLRFKPYDQSIIVGRDTDPQLDDFRATMSPRGFSFSSNNATGGFGFSGIDVVGEYNSFNIDVWGEDGTEAPSFTLSDSRSISTLADITIEPTDITLSGSSNTWDGTHTSLKDAIQAASGGGYTELTGTLTAGQTTLTIQNNAITTTATYDFFTDAFGVSPTDVEVTTGQIVLTFEEQESDVSVKVRIS